MPCRQVRAALPVRTDGGRAALHQSAQRLLERGAEGAHALSVHVHGARQVRGQLRGATGLVRGWGQGYGADRRRWFSYSLIMVSCPLGELGVTSRRQ